MSGPIVVTTTSLSPVATPTPTSLTAYRRELAPRIGPFSLVTTTGTPSGPDELRAIVSSALADPVAGPTTFDGRYTYIASGDNAGASSAVFPGGFDGPGGVLYNATPYANLLPGGVEVEVSQPLPAIADGDLFGLNDAIRTALLTSLWVHQYYGLAYVAQQVRYRFDTLGLPFVPRAEDLVEVCRPIPAGYTAAQTRPQPISRGLWSYEDDADQPYLWLRTGFNDGETFFVVWRRPAGTWVSTGGVWASSETGPVNETDACLYDAPTVARAALPIALSRLVAYHRARGQDDRAARYEVARQRAAVAAVGARRFRGLGRRGVQKVGAR